MDISLFRLKMIETSKWGKKPIYTEGADSICFNYYVVSLENVKYFILYNFSGTKNIEFLYIHGIWKINESNHS